MCGILFAACVVPDGQELPLEFLKRFEHLKGPNRQRGPDYCSQHHTSILTEPSGNRIHLFFFSAVLGLRGENITHQPLVSASGNVLCYNGEIFGGIRIEANHNDAVELARCLEETPSEELPLVFNSIEGPHALVYYHRTSGRIYYCRDLLGRRSLLQRTGSCEGLDYLILTSVADAAQDQKPPFQEVPAETIWVLPLRETNQDILAPTHSPHLLPSVPLLNSRTRELPRVSRVVTSEGCPIRKLSDRLSQTHPLSIAADGLLDSLNKSVQTRVQTFSRTLAKNMQHEIGEILPRANIAILFSGGIDSTVVAYLADRHVSKGEAIDLLNVAFENPRKLRPASGNNGRSRNTPPCSSQSTTTTDYMVPDRVTGLEEVEELRSLCPDRIWNFVEINVDFEAAKAARSKLVTLMHPCNTNMDLSLALALYFASEGKGMIRKSPGDVPQEYRSTARLLLNGLGSDELLGGYGRHLSACLNGGWPSLAEELQLDLDRISTRNLGRDDRVVACHGKELRHPFLDLEVIRTVASMPLNYKVEPRLSAGIGNKLLLRIVTARVGLFLASERKKRAMQFGSHSARMESGGNDKKGHSILSQ